MTSIIALAIGASAAGFIVGALLVHWAYRPVRYERAGFEAEPAWNLPPATPLAPHVDCTAIVTGNPEYKGKDHDRR